MAGSFGFPWTNYKSLRARNRKKKSQNVFFGGSAKKSPKTPEKVKQYWKSLLATGKYRCREVRVYPAECDEQLGRGYFEESLAGENVLGLVPASLPHTLAYACAFYAPTSPPPSLQTAKKTLFETSLRFWARRAQRLL